MSALIPTLPLPTACGSSTFSGSKGKGKASTRWTASDAEMPPTWLALVATSMEEEHCEYSRPATLEKAKAGGLEVGVGVHAGRNPVDLKERKSRAHPLSSLLPRRVDRLA